MISERDKIEQLKRDLRSYRFYNAKIAEYDEELEEIAVRLQGVKAVRYDLAHGSNAQHGGDNRMYWIMQESKLINERKWYADAVHKIETILGRVDDQTRAMLVEVFVDRKNYDDVAEEMGINRRSLYRKLDYAIRELIKK